MLEGGRPEECYYCRNVENLPGEHFSDRMFHSSSHWLNAAEETERIRNIPWDADFNPYFLEVSFGAGCNFKCGYCCPQASSLWEDEIRKHGNYDISYNQYGIDYLQHTKVYADDEYNPYVEAFWKWWPELYKDLHTFRITGGEPLLHKSTWRTFDELKADPKPHLEINLNSNLGVKNSLVKKLAEEVNVLLENKAIKKFKLFSSMDTWGTRAEYLRTGLKLPIWEENLDTFVRTAKSPVTFMCTFNILSVTSFISFLEKVLEWRAKYDDVIPIFDDKFPETRKIKIGRAHV